MRSIIFLLVVLMCSMVITPKNTFAAASLSDMFITPNGDLNFFGGFIGGTGNWDANPPNDELDWSIGNRPMFGSLSTDDLVISTMLPTAPNIADGWRHPDNWFERMRITNDGRVGIGTSSPDKKLTVNGDVKVEGKLIPEGGIITTSNIIIESQGDHIQIIAGGSRINIDPTGGISIQGGRDINIVSGSNLSVNTDNNLNFKIGGSLDFVVGKNISVKAGEEIIVQAGKSTNIQAGQGVEVTASDNVVVQTGRAGLIMDGLGDIDLQGKDIKVSASGTITHKEGTP